MNKTSNGRYNTPIYRNMGYNSLQKPTTRKSKKNQLPILWVIVLDVFIAALLLLAFSLYYFIIPRDESQNAVALPVPSSYTQGHSVKSSPAPSKPAASATQTAPANSSPSASETPAVSEPPADTSMWGAKWPEKFTADGSVEKDNKSYKSGNINVSIQKVAKDGATYYIADIYLKDLKYFQTALAHDKFGHATREDPLAMAKRHKAVLAINGDFCSLNEGAVVRNGVQYRDEMAHDVLVMFYDGTMQTYSRKQFSIDKMKDQGLYQVWTFGPMLLKDGQAMTDFDVDNSLTGGDVKREPRTAIGYFEPGHYCFVVVDGRQGSYSHGHSLEELSQLFADLGCKVAFNLDGGQSTEMLLQNKRVNKPYDNGRDTSDIVLITDEAE